MLPKATDLQKNCGVNCFRIEYSHWHCPEGAKVCFGGFLRNCSRGASLISNAVSCHEKI